MSEIAIFTRWVKQKVKCLVKENGEILEVVEILDEEIEDDNYTKI